MPIRTVQAVINGVTTDLVYNTTSGMYEKTISAPNKSSFNINTDHYFPITIKATDDAGNVITKNDSDVELGNKLRIVVRETVAPGITITSPTDEEKKSNNMPTVTFKVTDNDSGVNVDTIGITIDNGSKITGGIIKTPITGGYQCSYQIGSQLSDGSHAIKIDAADNDGNNAIQRAVSFAIDTTPPNLSVTQPANNLITNAESISVSGTTNDALSSSCVVTVKLNNGTAQTVTVGSDGNFATNVSLSKGVNTIVIISTDDVGKFSMVTRTVVLDNDAPIISSVTVTPNPVNIGEQFTVSVSVTD